MDVHAMESGLDSAKVIEEYVRKCSVLLVIIGRGWLASQATGKRRVDDPGDFQRLEIAAALKRGIRVIPVLVQGATVPREEHLPDGLKRFAHHHALEISTARWDHDVGRLFEVVDRILKRDRRVEAQTSPPVKRPRQKATPARTREDAVTGPPPTTRTPPVHAVPSEAVSQHDAPSGEREGTESSPGVGWKLAVGVAVVGIALAVGLWRGAGLLVAEPATSLARSTAVAQPTGDQEPTAAASGLSEESRETSAAVATPTRGPEAPREAPESSAPAAAAIADVGNDPPAEPQLDALEPMTETPTPATSVDTPAAEPASTEPPDRSPTPEQASERAEPTTRAASPPSRLPELAGVKVAFRDRAGSVVAGVGVTVRLVGHDSEETFETATSEGGVYTFDSIPPGEYSVLFIRDGETLADAALSIEKGPIRTRIFSLGPAAPPG